MLCLLLLPAAPGKSPQEESCPPGSGTRLGRPESQEHWLFCFHHFVLCPLPLPQPSSGYLLPPFRYTPNCSKSTTPQELLLCCLPLGCCSSSSNASNWKKHPYHRSLLMKEQLRESQAHLHLIYIFLCTALLSFPLSLFGKCRRGKKKTLQIQQLPCAVSQPTPILLLQEPRFSRCSSSSPRFSRCQTISLLLLLLLDYSSKQAASAKLFDFTSSLLF